MKVFILTMGENYEGPSSIKVFNSLKAAKRCALAKGFHNFKDNLFHGDRITAEKLLQGGCLEIGDFLLKIESYDNLYGRKHPEIVELDYYDWCSIQEQELLG